MSCSLTLSEREIKMLGWLAGYGGDNIAKAICDKLTTQFTKDEWNKLWQELREQLEQMSSRFGDTRQVFTGERKVKLPCLIDLAQ